MANEAADATESTVVGKAEANVADETNDAEIVEADQAVWPTRPLMPLKPPRPTRLM